MALVLILLAVSLLAFGLSMTLLFIWLRAQRRERLRPTPPPPAPRREPLPPPPPPPPPPDEEQVQRALRSHLTEAADRWFTRLRRRCPRCEAEALVTTKSNYQSHSTMRGGFALEDVAQRCDACGWQVSRRGVLNHISPAPTHWRKLGSRPRGPRLKWRIGGHSGVELGQVLSGGDAATEATPYEDDARPAVGLAAALIEVALRVESAPVEGEALLELQRAAVNEALILGRVLGVEAVE